MTLGYYIPRTIMPSRSTVIVGYYTLELVFISNPTIVDLELEHNQLLTQLDIYVTWIKNLHIDLVLNNL